MPAAERREMVLEAAIAEFAAHGLAGTSTEDVARQAGISQPYLFRLFPTKKALFIALIEHSFARVREAFIAAVGDLTGEDAMHAMGEQYGEMLRDRDALLLQLHCYAACDDPQIAEATRREFGRLWREVVRLSGAGDEEMQAFFAMGMLMNVIAAMDATSYGTDWVEACVPPAWIAQPLD
jgi:AcrR family transcriptional regulator